MILLIFAGPSYYMYTFNELLLNELACLKKRFMKFVFQNQIVNADIFLDRQTSSKKPFTKQTKPNVPSRKRFQSEQTQRHPLQQIESENSDYEFEKSTSYRRFKGKLVTTKLSGAQLGRKLIPPGVAHSFGGVRAIIQLCYIT